MYNLVIDIGNTLTKFALFNNRSIVKLHSANNVSPQVIDEFASSFAVKNAIVSTVKPHIEELEQYLQSKFRYLRFKTSEKTLINNRYKTPNTLGLDRYAAVNGAAHIFPGSDCLVIDAGTCITYDFIDKEKNYYGGSISPGIAMRYKAMHTFTGKLPLIAFDSDFNGVRGEDTRTSMLSGVQGGVYYEVEGFIKAYQGQYPGLVVLLCGGDADFFDRQLKNSIFAPVVKSEPHLVLIGLNEVIYQHND